MGSYLEIIGAFTICAYFAWIFLFLRPSYDSEMKTLEASFSIGWRAGFAFVLSMIVSNIAKNIYLYIACSVVMILFISHILIQYRKIMINNNFDSNFSNKFVVSAIVLVVGYFLFLVGRIIQRFF